MYTTIQVTKQVKTQLDRMKEFDRESYNNILERVLEDYKEVNEQTKHDIEASRRQFREGKFKTMEEVERELGFK